MGGTHKLLPLAEVKAGMVLSDALCTATGTVLLPAGTVLNDIMLQSLHRHKLDAVPILFELKTMSAHDLAEREKRLKYLFRKHDLAATDHAGGLLHTLLHTYRQQEDV